MFDALGNLPGLDGYSVAALGWIGAISLLTFVGSLLAVPWAVIRIPPDYFLRPDSDTGAHDSHWAWRMTLRVLRNVLGVVLLIGGILMLVLPGQGLLTMLLGVMLLDIPGKRRLELSIVRRPPVLSALNWLRDKAGHPPLIVDAD